MRLQQLLISVKLIQKPSSQTTSERFGGYWRIGSNCFFHSDRIHSYMVYMPAGLCYPWHQNPAEELYLCLAVETVFKKRSCEDGILCSSLAFGFYFIIYVIFFINFFYLTIRKFFFFGFSNSVTQISVKY